MFFNNFKALCESKGKSMSAVAIELKIPKSSVTTWKKNNFIPRADTLTKIADYFNVSTDYLLGNEQKEKSLSEEDKLIAEINNILTTKTKEELLFYKELANRLSKEK